MNWKGKRIAVVGDIMLDHYSIGDVERISPEAPVPIIRHRKDRYVVGGAANAAANVASLGGESHLFGVIGQDIYGDKLLDEIALLNIGASGILEDQTRLTTRKERIVSSTHHDQQIARVDYESNHPIQRHLEERLVNLVEKSNPNAIVISDYAKGVITSYLVSQLVALSKRAGIPIIADPKPRDNIEYLGVNLVTPNKKEAESLSGIVFRSEDDIRRAGSLLHQKLSSDVLITLGDQGMALFERNKEPYFIPTFAKQVSDVSGAGDTVIATLSLGLAAGMPLREAVELSNKAAGIKVTKLGTATVSWEELFKEH